MQVQVFGTYKSFKNGLNPPSKLKDFIYNAMSTGGLISTVLLAQDLNSSAQLLARGHEGSGLRRSILLKRGFGIVSREGNLLSYNNKVDQYVFRGRIIGLSKEGNNEIFLRNPLRIEGLVTTLSRTPEQDLVVK